MVAIISYLLLKFYLMYLQKQKGSDLDEMERASAVARVSRIVDIIDRILILWFKFLLVVVIILFVATIITLFISLLGSISESAWIASIARWNFDAITQVVSKFGVAISLTILAISLGLCAIVVYLILRLLFKKKLA